MNKPAFSILPAADGQPERETGHSIAYQEAVTAGAALAECWMTDPDGVSFAQRLESHLLNVAGSARAAFTEGFLLRVEQRLLAGAAPMANEAIEPPQAASTEPQGAKHE